MSQVPHSAPAGPAQPLAEAMVTATANSIFGTLELGKAEDVFTIRASAGINTNEIMQTALKRDLDRLNGFRTDITPAKAKQLTKLRSDIARIEQNASPDGLNEKEINERASLFRQANEILGKPYVNVRADRVLSNLVDQVDALLEPKLQGAQKRRLENLRSLEEKYLDAFLGGNKSRALRQQLTNVQSQVSSLTPPRKMNELTSRERQQYDALVAQINDRAGSEYLLPSRKKARAESIQAAMSKLGPV